MRNVWNGFDTEEANGLMVLENVVGIAAWKVEKEKALGTSRASRRSKALGLKGR